MEVAKLIKIIHIPIIQLFLDIFNLSLRRKIKEKMHFIKQKIVLSLFLLILCVTLQAQKAFEAGEILKYKVSYHWGILWLSAGTVEFEVKENILPGYLDFVVTGRTYKQYDPFFKVRETYTSTVFTTTLLPVFSGRDAIEGKYWAKENCHFNQEKGTVHCVISRSTGKNTDSTLVDAQNTFDILSAAYFFRDKDFSAMKKNEVFPLKVIVDGELYSIIVKYLGNETCSSAGKKYDCAKFSLNTIKGTIFTGNDKIHLWVTNDERKIPIRLTSKIQVGEVDVKFVSSSWQTLSRR